MPHPSSCPTTMFASRLSLTLFVLHPSARNSLRTFATINVKDTNRTLAVSVTLYIPTVVSHPTHTENRVIGGLEATLHSLKSWEEAKEHVSERIEELTVSPSESSDASQQHKNHVLGG